MEQHPIPRQITTFEFKLVGFMTLKQFIYLVVFIPLAYVVFSLFPIPVLNFLLALIVAFIGIALAFLPVNDRPLDVFVKNLIKRVLSPTQYFYKKLNEPVYFLGGKQQRFDPAKLSMFLDSQKKLSNYLQTKNQKAKEEEPTPEPQTEQRPREFVTQLPPEAPKLQQKEEPQQPSPPNASFNDRMVPIGEKKPFLVGVVKSNRQNPLPGVLVYLKDQTDTAVRLLKTNPHGVFATFNPLPQGEYTVEIKDPNQAFYFDTMKITLDEKNPKPLEVYSKERL